MKPKMMGVAAKVVKGTIALKMLYTLVHLVG